MKNKLTLKFAAGLVLFATLGLPISAVLAQGAAFTYQGQLQNNGSPASGTYNLTFSLYNASSGGSVVAGPLTISGVIVSNGLFTVQIDFGAGVFTGQTNYLEIGVETNGGGSFTTLSPRQQLTPTPYAIFSESAGNLVGTLPASQITGQISNGQLANSSITVSPGTGLTGGGTVPLGGSTMLNNAGVLSVAGPGDITASTVNGAVTLGSDATSANTASTIAKRDVTGSFSAQNITLAGNLYLPYPAIIYAGGNPTLIDEGSFFAGGAGNTTLTGVSDVGVGLNALHAVTTGSDNVAVGEYALYANSTGNQNTALGWYTLNSNTNGSNNTAVGQEALRYNINSFNTALGALSLGGNPGNGNTAVGFEALFNGGNLNPLGSNNIALGYQAGYNLQYGNFNIDIGNMGLSSFEGNTIRIGTQGTQSSAYVAGIYGTAIAANSPFVVVNSSGQLGTVSGVGNSQLANSSLTINAGTGLSGGGTVALGGSTTLNNAGVLSVTAALPLSSSGGQNPQISLTGVVPSGSLSGTYGSAVTFNNASDSFAGNGSSLTSLNASQLTSGTVPSAVVSGTYANAVTFNNAGNSFSGNGAGLTSLSASHLTSIGNTSGSGNFFVGSAGNSTTSGQQNVAVGANTLPAITSGSDNTAIGEFTMISDTTGSQNTAYGEGALYNNVSGSGNIGVGYQGGINLTGNNNIDIGNSGVAGENDIIRIGTQGVQTACYLAGTVYANGTFVSSSDRNAKENFEAVAPRDVLDKVSALPISRWNYKTDKGSEHIGPMAQDFWAAFKVGMDDKHIATVDEEGVALAAIQGLNQKVEEKEAKIQEQNSRIQNQAAEITELKARLDRLEQAISGK